MPPVIIIPRKKPLKNYQAPENVVLVYKTKATFNTSVIEEDFIDRVVIPHKLKNKLNNIALYIDSATCHKTKSLKKKAKRAKININFIPPNLTSYLQPADVMWMGAIKRKFHEKWEHWYQNEPKSFTKAGKIKSPGYENVSIFFYFNNTHRHHITRN